MSEQRPIPGGGLTVRGGPGGSRARVEDLERFASVTARTSSTVSGLADELVRTAGRDDWTTLILPVSGAAAWPPGCPARPDPVLVEARRRIGEIAWRAEGLRQVAEELSGLAARARLVATAFATADASAAAAFDGLSWATGFVLSRVGGALLPPPFGTAGPAVAGAPSAGVLGVGVRAAPGVMGAALVAGRPGAAQPVIGMVPGLVSGAGPLRPGSVPDLALTGLGAARLSPWLHESTDVVLLPSGSPRNRPNSTPIRPPAGVGGVVELLERAETGGRSVVVERITAPDGRRSWVVAVPGLQTWTPTAGSNPYDLTAAVRAMARQRPAVTVHLTEALATAGARPGEPVLLAGHSLGGMAVAQAAADPAFRRRFTVTHVLTAGSPVAHARIPTPIRVLSLEHGEDVVPALDGADNPDRPRWVTVRGSAPGVPADGPTGAGLRAHDVRAYRWTALRADRAGAGVLAGWREGFDAFAVPDGQVRTWQFAARRAG